MHVIHRSGKHGLGGAYLEAFRWGLERDYTLFFEMDADFSHRPDDLPFFIEKARTSISFSDLVTSVAVLQ